MRCAQTDLVAYNDEDDFQLSICVESQRSQVMNINAGLRTLYKDKMYLCKHECDHVLGYLVMEERKKEREFYTSRHSFNSTLRKITFFLLYRYVF